MHKPVKVPVKHGAVDIGPGKPWYLSKKKKIKDSDEDIKKGEIYKAYS
jgi:hypothetical protein